MKNDHRSDSIINLHELYVAKLGFEHATPGSAVRCATDRIMELAEYPKN